MSLPETLGRLERVGRLGSGGFASVWLYHDPDLSSDVAVKALADNWTQRADVRDRFVEEARILRRADSEYVVRVHDIGEVGETPYFVMTYADGGSLADLLGSGPVPPERVVDLVEQAAAGLDALHENGIIHRDVKPQNLLLRSHPDGERVLVADLGVAKAMANASGLTQLVGTPAYMAPEQAAGLRLDARTDVWSLGAIAFTLLTGHTLRDPEALRLGSEPPRPSLLVDLPAGVDTAVAGALADDPEDRYPSAGAFARALRAGWEGEEVQRRPASGSATVSWTRVLVLSLLVLAATFIASYLVVGAVV
ncbi:serine/threonine protein kinase [Nocardioides rotundus]|uniref:serine/threonine-protein kinase n=1 Tax=Nocardioides rotundus TaxID=1774216 RepID=UPI001CBDE1F0|nr:serine/threonine-protein kinase [Nocardioides rotundus]UAL29204.1 serine/threonine protein kinase [Nocardioides rotundus]